METEHISKRMSTDNVSFLFDQYVQVYVLFKLSYLLTFHAISKSYQFYKNTEKEPFNYFLRCGENE